MDESKTEAGPVVRNRFPVFVAGCGRSGTTFLADQIGKAAGYIVIPESQFKGDLLRCDWNDDMARERAVHALLDSWRLSIWNMSDRLTPDLLSAARSTRAVMEVLIDLYAPEHQAHAAGWVDHTPSNVNLLASLSAEFPGSRFIHLLRDPRAVWASVRDLDWGPHSVLSFVAWWTQAVAKGLSGEVMLADDILRVRYEDFCHAPQAWIATIAQHLQVSLAYQSDSMAAGFKVPEYTRYQHVLVGKEPSITQVDRWKSLLSRREIEIIESELGPLMYDFGYETTRRNTHNKPTFAARAADAVRSAPRFLAQNLKRRTRILLQRGRRLRRS